MLAERPFQLPLAQGIRRTNEGPIWFSEKSLDSKQLANRVIER